MARLTPRQKEQLIADFDAGISQNQLALNYDVSTATVNKYCKGREPKNKDKVKALVAVNMALYAQSECEVNAVVNEVNAEVAFRLRNDKDMQSIQDKVNAMVHEIDSPQAALALMTATVKHREAKLGKSPDTAIQINNQPQQPQLTVVIDG